MIRIGILLPFLILGIFTITAAALAQPAPSSMPPITRPNRPPPLPRMPQVPVTAEQAQAPTEGTAAEGTPGSKLPPSKFEFMITLQDKSMWSQVLTGFEACIGSVRVISRNETCANLFIFLEQFNKRVQEAQVPTGKDGQP